MDDLRLAFRQVGDGERNDQQPAADAHQRVPDDRFMACGTWHGGHSGRKRTTRGRPSLAPRSYARSLCIRPERCDSLAALLRQHAAKDYSAAATCVAGCRYAASNSASRFSALSMFSSLTWPNPRMASGSEAISIAMA